MPATPVYGLRYQSLSDAPNGAALGQNLAEDVEATLQGTLTLGASVVVPGTAVVAGALTVGGVNIGTTLSAIHTAGINNVTGAGTTTSASYANLAATSSFAFTKELTGTNLLVNFAITTFSTSNDTVSRFAVLVGGTDYDLCGRYHNSANIHGQVVGSRVLTGIAAGSLTIQGRWKRVSGAGTLTTDVNTWLSITCSEIPV